MGKLEEENRKIVRRTKIQEAILATLASGGRLGATALVPEVFNYLLKLDLPSSIRKNDVVKSAAARLRKKGLLTFENGHYLLTSAGEKVFDSWQMANYKIKRPRKWDGKWRVVIFDIPEKKRTIRTQVRQILAKSGFQRLQDSVWVYPYDCEDVIGLMKINFGIGKYLLYIIADQIEKDKYLRVDFNIL